MNRRDDRGRGSTKAYVVHAGRWSAAVAAIRPQFGGTYDVQQVGTRIAVAQAL